MVSNSVINEQPLCFFLVLPSSIFVPPTFQESFFDTHCSLWCNMLIKQACGSVFHWLLLLYYHAMCFLMIKHIYRFRYLGQEEWLTEVRAVWNLWWGYVSWRNVRVFFLCPTRLLSFLFITGFPLYLHRLVVDEDKASHIYIHTYIIMNVGILWEKGGVWVITCSFKLWNSTDRSWHTHTVSANVSSSILNPLWYKIVLYIQMSTSSRSLVTTGLFHCKHLDFS